MSQRAAISIKISSVAPARLTRMRPYIMLSLATALFAIGRSARRSDFTAPVPVAGNPSASYRRALADSGVSGQVIAEGVVDTTGAVVPNSITIVQPLHPALDEEVVRVFSLWKFRPAVRDGQVVE